MKQKAIIVSSYAILILIGGLIGYVAAKSIISLIASSVFAILLFLCSYFIWKGYLSAYRAASVIVGFLFLFFAYRYTLTYKFTPAGIMSIVSAGLFIYLIAGRKRVANLLQ